MNSARTATATDTRYRILAYMLTAALLLSTGLNLCLLRGSGTSVQQAESAAAEELAAVENELVQARHQLACCQHGDVSDTLTLQTDEQARRASF